MTPTTEIKAAALKLRLHAIDWIEPSAIDSTAELLAMLTSQDKQERERAKNMVRDMVRQGQKIQADQRAALALIERGERCDERP